MAKLGVKLTSLYDIAPIRKGANATIPTEGTVEVQTPSGQVYVSYDETAGMALVVVRGEKGSTTIKFNEKALV